MDVDLRVVRGLEMGIGRLRGQGLIGSLAAGGEGLEKAGMEASGNEQKTASNMVDHV